MSLNTITKEQYLDELATKAAARIAEGTTLQTMKIMIPVFKKIILEELRPILRLV